MRNGPVCESEAPLVLRGIEIWDSYDDNDKGQVHNEIWSDRNLQDQQGVAKGPRLRS